MLNNPIEQYKLNLQSARDLETIYIALNTMTANAVPKDELLRAELVSLVSALDTYVHDIVREGLKYIYQNTGSNRYIIWFIDEHSINSLEDLERKIRDIHGFKTFQAPKKISEALKLLGIVDVWSRIEIDIPDVKTSLKLIVERRNKIAHESDINPTNGLGEKWPIDLTMVQAVVDSIDDIVNRLDRLIQQELI